MCGQHAPLLTTEAAQSTECEAQIRRAVEENERLQVVDPCPAEGVRAAVRHWRELGASESVCYIIEKGVKLRLHKLPPVTPPQTAPAQLDEALREYAELGAMRRLTADEVATTKQWVRAFPRQKRDTGKVRLITNLKPLNQCFKTPHFKADSWNTLTAMLRDHPENVWGVTVDLRHWFFHLYLHTSSQRWTRIRTKDGGIQFQKLPFGLACSPLWTARLANVIIKSLRDRGLVLVYMWKTSYSLGGAGNKFSMPWNNWWSCSIP